MGCNPAGAGYVNGGPQVLVLRKEEELDIILEMDMTFLVTEVWLDLCVHHMVSEIMKSTYFV